MNNIEEYLKDKIWDALVEELKDKIWHDLFEFFNRYASLIKTLNCFEKYWRLEKLWIFNQRDTIKKILIEQRVLWRALEEKNIRDNSFYNEIIRNTTNEIFKLSTK